MTGRRFEFEKEGERQRVRSAAGPLRLLERRGDVVVSMPAEAIGREIRGAVEVQEPTRGSVEDSEALTRELVGVPNRGLTRLEREFGAAIEIVSRFICDLLPCGRETVSASLADALETNNPGAHVFLVNPFLAAPMIPGMQPFGFSQRLSSVALITVGLEIAQAEKRNDLNSLAQIRRFIPPERGVFGIKNPTITLILKDLDAAEAAVRARLGQ